MHKEKFLQYPYPVHYLKEILYGAIRHRSTNWHFQYTNLSTNLDAILKRVEN